MSNAPQNLKNHARFDPPYHFGLLLVLLLNIIFTIIYFLRHHETRHAAIVHGWIVIMAIAFFVMAAKLRFYPLTVQDRVIRLEEKLRLQSLGVPAATIDKLTVDQLIALRFAPDAEVPGLAARAVTENLSRKQIKELIINWRADNLRV